MQYIKVYDDGAVEYPYDRELVRVSNPNVSFPREISDSILAEYGIYLVVETERPTVSVFNKVIEASPVFADGKWRQQWTTRLASPPDSITRRQCALQLLVTQTITPEEALAMTKAGDVPAAIAAIFDAAVTNGTMTADQRIFAEIDFAAPSYYRSNSLLLLMGLTEAEIDQFFIAASKL